MELRIVERGEMEVRGRMEGYLPSPKGFHCSEKDLRLSGNITVAIFMQKIK